MSDLYILFAAHAGGTVSKRSSTCWRGVINEQVVYFHMPVSILLEEYIEVLTPAGIESFTDAKKASNYLFRKFPIRNKI